MFRIEQLSTELERLPSLQQEIEKAQQVSFLHFCHKLIKHRLGKKRFGD